MSRQPRSHSAGLFRCSEGYMETHCVAGHIGFEPPNPAAGYLIGFA